MNGGLGFGGASPGIIVSIMNGGLNYRISFIFLPAVIQYAGAERILTRSPKDVVESGDYNTNVYIKGLVRNESNKLVY